MSGKVRTLFGQLPHLPRALRLTWGTARGWTVAWAGLLVVQGLLPLATVFIAKLVVDNVVAGSKSDGSWDKIQPAVFWVILMAAILLVSELLRSLGAWIRAAQAQILRDHLSTLIHQKSVELDMAFYESPDYFDHLHRAREESGHRPIALLESVGSLAQNTLTLVAMGAVLLQFGLWLPIALVVSTLPALLVVLHYSTRQHAWRQQATSDERRAWYYDWLLTAPESAAELRLFALGDYFQAAFQKLRARLRADQIQLARQQAFAEIAAATVGLVITGAAAAWMVWQAARGAVSLGDLALFYVAFNHGQTLMRALLHNVGQIYANTLFLGDLFEFLSLAPKMTAPLTPITLPNTAEISFRDVNFHYPASERVALREFTLRIHAGQISAIVGPNGAGKSTLVKLLCRFYDPDSGVITLGGVDLRELNIEELRSNISVLFQQPIHYNMTAAENIRLGNLQNNGAMNIETAARAAWADQTIARLPQQYETPLGKWFDGGTDLSVGEWQRLALARALVRPSPILLLDEPTSAMDSWTEAQWVRKLRETVAGRTVLMITHRFTTAMCADKIYVMDDGRIVEAGNHTELLQSNGLYAQSWLSQTEKK